MVGSGIFRHPINYKTSQRPEMDHSEQDQLLNRREKFLQDVRRRAEPTSPSSRDTGQEGENGRTWKRREKVVKKNNQESRIPRYYYISSIHKLLL